MKTAFVSTLVALLAATSAPGQTAPASDSTTWLDYSLNYSRGDYGFTQDTEVNLGLLTATNETPNWRFQVLVPVLNIKGPASVAAGGAAGGSAAARPTTSS